jgi:hypothetical protein
LDLAPPGELPETPVLPEVLTTDEILVDGQVVNLSHIVQGDVEGSTIFHVPSDTVVCGDVVYNNVHMMMYEADEAKRAAWIASIDTVAGLNPRIVVAGHKSVGAADLPENLAASQQYLRDFTTLAKKGGAGEDLVHGLLEMHGERDQPHTLWISARAEVVRRHEPHRSGNSPYALTIRPPEADRAAWWTSPIMPLAVDASARNAR